MSGLTLADARRERERLPMLVRKAPGAHPHDRAGALSRLEKRLAHWHGEDVPYPGRRFKSNAPRLTSGALEVDLDRVELLIVRAISATNGSHQFGVARNGCVFTASTNGWSRDERVYVAGLSPLLDDAAEIFNDMRGRKGGRFFERQHEFIDAQSKRTFLRQVANGARTVDQYERYGPVARGIPGTAPTRATAPAAAAVTCPVCFTLYRANGTCNCP